MEAFAMFYCQFPARGARPELHSGLPMWGSVVLIKVRKNCQALDILGVVDVKMG